MLFAEAVPFWKFTFDTIGGLEHDPASGQTVRYPPDLGPAAATTRLTAVTPLDGTASEPVPMPVTATETADAPLGASRGALAEGRFSPAQ